MSTATDRKPPPSVDEWRDKADDAKRRAAEAKAAAEAEAKRLAEAAKAVSAVEFENWKKRKSTISVATEVRDPVRSTVIGEVRKQLPLPMVAASASTVPPPLHHYLAAAMA